MRADAVRNRDAVLAAATRLFAAAQDPGAVSLNAVAAEACVGKGTVLRSFGDRSGLLRAVFDAHAAAELQALLPLVGGSPPERVVHLLTALWAFKRRHRVLTATLEREHGADASPYRSSTYVHWHAALHAELAPSWPGSAGFLAHALLAAVRSDLVEHLHEMPDEVVWAGLHDLVTAVLPGASSS